MTSSVERAAQHAAHCCALHGCKYGVECPVVDEVLLQHSACEQCASVENGSYYEFVIEVFASPDWRTVEGPFSTSVRTAIKKLTMARAYSAGYQLRLSFREVSQWRSVDPAQTVR